MAKTFLDDIDIAEQSSSPGSPASGYQRIYPKSDGFLYIKNSSGVETKLNPDISANRQTADYVLALTDKDNLVEMNVATANVVTVPLNSTVAFPVGSQILISQYGAGVTSVAPAGGVTIRSVNGSLNLGIQYSAATLVKIGTNEWYLFGAIDQPNISSGTAAPSGGNDGDIYLQYV